MKTRLDVYLVEKGLAKSRSQAQQLIQGGHVSVDGRVLDKASLEISPESKIEVSENSLNRYVSRGGLKLEGALKRISLDVNEKLVLDIGISTGGFTDCLLQAGARQVYGVDVGHDQTDPKIKVDSRVVIIEGVNARDLGSVKLPSQFDTVVVDVSFISLELILPEALKKLRPGGAILALVKPQFEAGRAALGKNGVIKEPKAFEEVRKKIYKICETLQLQVEDYFESDITGSDGNREFFVYARSHGDS